MEVISVYYKDLKVGELTFDGENYIYNVNETNVKFARERGYFLSLYKCNKSFVSKELPQPFKDFVLDNKTVLTFPETKIRPFDDDFTRLYKFALLKNVDKSDFHFEVD